MAEEEGEHILLQLRECQVYKIPPRTNAAGHYAKDWGELSKPIWVGRCVLTERGEDLFVKLQGDDGRDFAVCKAGPGAIEPVVDSSRYFVLRIEDPRTGRHAFLGVGFLERSQAFDFNAAIADHDKHIRMEREAEKAAKEYEARPKLDLSLKAPITVSLNISKTATKEKQVGTGILAPPPGKNVVFSPPRASSATASQSSAAKPKEAVPSDFSFGDDWGDFESAPSPAAKPAPAAAAAPTPTKPADDFLASISTPSPPTAKASPPTSLFGGLQTSSPTVSPLTAKAYSPSPLGAGGIPLGAVASPYGAVASPYGAVSPTLGAKQAVPLVGVPGLSAGIPVAGAVPYGAVPYGVGLPGAVAYNPQLVGAQPLGMTASPLGSPYAGLARPGAPLPGSPSTLPLGTSSPKAPASSAPDPFAGLASFK